jgi:hypothetical protein
VAIHQSSPLNQAVKGLIAQAQKQVVIDKKSKKEANLSSKRAKTPLQKNQQIQDEISLEPEFLKIFK